MKFPTSKAGWLEWEFVQELDKWPWRLVAACFVWILTLLIMLCLCVIPAVLHADVWPWIVINGNALASIFYLKLLPRMSYWVHLDADQDNAVKFYDMLSKEERQQLPGNFVEVVEQNPQEAHDMYFSGHKVITAYRKKQEQLRVTSGAVATALEQMRLQHENIQGEISLIQELEGSHGTQDW